MKELCKKEWGQKKVDLYEKRKKGNYRKHQEAVKQNRSYATKYLIDVSNTFPLGNFEL